MNLCHNVSKLSGFIFSHFPIFCFNRQSIQVDPQAKTATFPAAASQGSEGRHECPLQTSTVSLVKRGLAAMAEEDCGSRYGELKVGSPCLRYPGPGRQSTRGHLRSLGPWLAAVWASPAKTVPHAACPQTVNGGHGASEALFPGFSPPLLAVWVNRPVGLCLYTCTAERTSSYSTPSIQPNCRLSLSRTFENTHTKHWHVPQIDTSSDREPSDPRVLSYI